MLFLCYLFVCVANWNHLIIFFTPRVTLYIFFKISYTNTQKTIEKIWTKYKYISKKITHRSLIIITKNIKKKYLNIKSNGFNSKSLIRRASSSFKHNASFVARLPTIRRHKSQSLHSPGNLKPSGGSQRGRNCPRTMNEINNSAENLGR